MSKSKSYRLRETLSATLAESLSVYPSLIQQLLVYRGVVNADDAQTFLFPEYDAQVHDPFLMQGMEKAVTRIMQALEDGEHIAIYSDFDADGIPAGALLHDLLKKCGHERFTNYIPHRDTEGYGFHQHAVDSLKKQGVTLIITVDVGISDVDTVAYAKENGIEVIITDHHLPENTLPDAVAVLDPHRVGETYPFKDLCGTGVALKLAQALLQQSREEDRAWVRDIPVGWEKWLLDLVAIATVSDMMPLVGENRALVYYGLIVLRKSRRVGIQALCRKMRITQRYLTEDEIGFTIGPRLNAASRMGEPEIGFTLLTTDDVAQAEQSAGALESLNNKRKGAVASMVRELKKRFTTDTPERVLVAGNPKWNPALLGLAANSLVDTYGKTVCLWGREGTGALKGSCRSNGEVHIVSLFERSTEALETYGGHAFAGGFAVVPECIHTLSETLNTAHDAIADEAVESEQIVDCELPKKELSQIHAEQSQLAPFGIANEKPIFICHGVLITGVRQFGSDDAHIELQLKLPHLTRSVRAIAFFKQPESFSVTPCEGESVSMIATVELSRFAGRTQFELRVVDIAGE